MDPALHQQGEQPEGQQRGEQPLWLQVGGVEQGNHGDCEQVVDDREGEQKSSQCHR